MFDKSKDTFPVKNNYIFLASCSVSPYYNAARKLESELRKKLSESGTAFFDLVTTDYVKKCKELLAQFIQTNSENISLVNTTGAGTNLIANSFPFRPGDEIITYCHEYPSNYYPWYLQARRGVKLVLLDNYDPIKKTRFSGKAVAWSFEQLASKITKNTRIVAISHVQFSSGFAVEIKKLADLCKSKGVYLVLDVAQSLGCMPIYPEKLGIDALVSSGWKWLLGALNIGIIYTSKSFRANLEYVVGADTSVKQFKEYHNLNWDPFEDGRRFEYAHTDLFYAAGLSVIMEQVFLKYGIENIYLEIQKLQTLFLNLISKDKFVPVEFDNQNRSGIMAFNVKIDPEKIDQILRKQGIVTVARYGYFRVAPHYYLTEEEIEKAVNIINKSY